MRRLSENEVEALILLAKKDSLRDAVMIALQFFHGLRSSEICELKVSQVNLTTSSISIIRKKGSLETAPSHARPQGQTASIEAEVGGCVAQREDCERVYVSTRRQRR